MRLGETDSHASDIGHWLGMTRQEGRLWRVAPGGAAGRCTPRVLVPLRSTAWASPPTEGCKGCGGIRGDEGIAPYGRSIEGADI